MAEAGTGYISLRPDFSKFSGRDITRGIDPGLDQTDKHITGKLGGTFKSVAALGAGLLGAAVVADFAKGIISASSDMNETLSKSNTIFGSAGAEIEKWAGTAARSFGQSKQGALDAASTFGNLFTQLGVGAEQAAKMSKAQTELASDFASFYNDSPEEAINAMTAAYRGEYDAVQKYVPTINAASVEQKALALGLAGSTKELTAQDKALAVNALLTEGAGKAAGDFDRTSGGLANTQRTLSAVWADAQVTLGEKLVPAVTVFAGFLADNLPKALDAAKGAFNKFGDAIDFVKRNWNILEPILVAGIALITPLLVSMGVEATVSAAKQVVAWVSTGAAAVASAIVHVAQIGIQVAQWAVMGVQAAAHAATVVAGWVAIAAAAVARTVVAVVQFGIQVAQWIAMGVVATAQALVIAAAWLISMGPIGLVIAAIVALVAVVVLNFDTIKETIGRAWEAIKSTTQAAWGSVKGFFDEAWKRIKDAVATGVLTIVGAFVTMAEKVVGAAATAFGWVPGIGDKLKDAEKAISKFKDDVNASLGKIQDKEVKITFKSYGSADAADRSQTGDGPGRGGPALSRVQSILTGIPGTYVTSTYRSPAANAAAGGSPTSYHMDRNNPAVDIGGSTSALNTVASKLRAAGGWRELLWQVKGHYDHVHVANTGGYVPGGGPDQDSVMAMLTPGEFVFSRTAVKAIGAGNLAGLHNQALAGFNAGGFVPYIKTVLAETPRDQWLRNFNTQFGNLVKVFESGDDVVNGAGEVIDNMFGNTGKLIPAVMGASDQLMRLWAVISDGDDVLSGFAEIVDNIFGNTGALAAPIFDMVKGSVLEDVNAANVAKQQNRYDTSLINAIGPDRQWGTPQDMSLYDEQLVGSLSGGSSRQWGSAEDMAEYDRKLIAAISGAVVAGVRQTVRTG